MHTLFRKTSSSILGVVIPLLLLVAYLVIFLLVLMLPNYLSPIFSVEKYGEGGSLLYLTYWSNLAMLIWLTIGTILFSISIVGCLIKTLIRMTKEDIEDSTYNRYVYPVAAAVVTIGFVSFLALAYIRDESIINIVNGYHSDINQLKAGETQIFQGKLRLEKLDQIEGGYYNEKADLIRWVTGIEGIAPYKENIFFRCQISQSKEIDIESKYTVHYLPHSKIIISIRILDLK
ncbi:MAG: hypothetical protein AB2421_02675 [Thermotaleaceae bacterium]